MSLDRVICRILLIEVAVPNRNRVIRGKSASRQQLIELTVKGDTAAVGRIELCTDRLDAEPGDVADR